MRPDTKTGPAVIEGNKVTIDPAIATRTSIDVPNLCSRCIESTFSPLTWSQLRCETLNPAIPDGENANYHIMSDLDFVVKMFTGRPCPRKRGPVIDLKIAAGDIVQSRDESCGFCAALALLDADGSILSKTDGKVVLRMQAFWPEKNNGAFHPMLLEIGLHPDIGGGGEIGLLAFIDENDEPAEGLEASTDQAVLLPLFDQIQAWFEKCKSAHTKCRSAKGQKLPTRVLDLLYLQDQEQIKLVESKEVDQGQYAMLSYVWGTSATLRLLQATESELLAGIKLERLSRTILDAATTAYTLGIRYLWIDALCIVQDSEPDKRLEIPRMAEYYHNASLVISASGAADVHAGFLHFQETAPEHYARVKNPNPQMQRAFGPVALQVPVHLPNISRRCLVDFLPRLYSYHREPINRRAWCLQESILPRRLLSFPATGGVIMRCLEGEALAGEITSNPRDETPRYASPGNIPGKEAFQLWCNLIEDYSRRSLSYRSDILVAIGALAREFNARHGATLGDYVAGLWTNYLREGLLWHGPPTINENPTALHVRQSTYNHAPSWSWASTTGPIGFDNKPEMYLPPQHTDKDEEYDRMFIPRWYCEVVDCKITPLSELGHFEAISAGVLNIRGPLRPLRPRKRDDGEDIGTGKREREGEPESTLMPLRTTGNEDATLSEPCLEGAYSLNKEPEMFSLDSNSSLDWCSGRRYCWLGIWYAGRGRARGLIVEQINETEFRRLGFAEYMVGQDDFPESNLQQEQIIRLI